MHPSHRDLVLNRERKPRFGFLKLPEALQDEIIRDLDSGALTLTGAADRCREAGYPLSHEAVARYYRAVRRERRLAEANRELTRLLESMRGQNTLDNLEAVTNLIAAMVSECLAESDGLLSRKHGPLDAIKALSFVMDAQARLERVRASRREKDAQAEETAEQSVEERRRKIEEAMAEAYGIVPRH